MGCNQSVDRNVIHDSDYTPPKWQRDEKKDERERQAFHDLQQEKIEELEYQWMMIEHGAPVIITFPFFFAFMLYWIYRCFKAMCSRGENELEMEEETSQSAPTQAPAPS